MSIRCLFGFHRRSRRHTQEEGSRFVSRCAMRRIPMEKANAGQWVVLTEPERTEPIE